MIKYKELKQKSKELERKYQLNHYELLQRFMFERLLERISVSKYQENFILKGGLLLSALFGINNRTTRDMDTTIKGLDVSKEQMVKVLNEILNIDLKDGVKFELVDVTDIREEDEYGGNKYHLIGKLENLKINLDIDIKNLKLSIKNTFDKRESLDYLKDYEQILDGISSYDRIVSLWNGYAKKNKYANDIKFEEIIKELKEFISSLDIEISTV